MGSPGRRVRRCLLLATVFLAAAALCLPRPAAADGVPDPNRQLHEAARSYYLAVQASVNDIDRALTLLNDAEARLTYVSGDADTQRIVGELSAHVRNTMVTLDARHRRLAALADDVEWLLDHHDPRGAVTKLSTIPRCLPGGAPPSLTDVSDRDCQPTADTHFDLDALHHRAQQDLTASHTFTGFVRQWFGNNQ